jgi:hypothetical protein
MLGTGFRVRVIRLTSQSRFMLSTLGNCWEPRKSQLEQGVLRDGGIRPERDM